MEMGQYSPPFLKTDKDKKENLHCLIMDLCDACGRPRIPKEWENVAKPRVSTLIRYFAVNVRLIDRGEKQLLSLQ